MVTPLNRAGAASLLIAEQLQQRFVESWQRLHRLMNGPGVDIAAMRLYLQSGCVSSWCRRIRAQRCER
jgi:hypothetical protein